MKIVRADLLGVPKVGMSIPIYVVWNVELSTWFEHDPCWALALAETACFVPPEPSL